MNEYNKIQTVFYRSPESNYKELMEGVWAMPEFEMLKDIRWVWTEMIDGTNIRIMWNGETVRFGGRTDDAQIPGFLLNVLQDKFSAHSMKMCFPGATDVCLYGEGYGSKIQKGKNYLGDRADFILFDCKVGNWWLTRESLEDIAAKIETAIVPIIANGSLTEAVEYVKKGFKSTIAINKTYNAEGLIMKPAAELFNRKGERLIAKIKHRDFVR